MSKLLKSRPFVIGLVVVVVLAGIGVARLLAARGKAAGATTTWATSAATVGRIAVTVSGTAALQPGNTADVRTEVTGVVRRLLVSNGESVTAGTPLLELENEALLLTWEQARLTFEEESEALTDLLEGTSSQSTAVRAAELKVEQARLNLETKQKAVDNLTVKAPAAGRILTVDAQPGDELASGGLVLSLVEGPAAQLTLQVDEEEVGRVRAGDRAALIFGPLPDVHTVTVTMYEQAVYGLRVGDAVTATIEGRWANTNSPIVRGTVVEIKTAGSMFQVVCRLPGLSSAIPAGANVSYMEIFPSGKQAGGKVISASGKVAVQTDVWGLDELQAKGQGTVATVKSVATQATKTSAGESVYAVTLTCAGYPEDARTGMSAHGYVWPAAGAAISGAGALELPVTRMAATAGGTVMDVLVRAGEAVREGQLLATVRNESLMYQLEEAKNALTQAEENLDRVTGSGEADRELRLQEIRTRQAELTLEARLKDVQALTVTAPQAGVVSGVNANLTAGKSVTLGTSACRVLNYESMQLVLQVDELEVAWVTPGLEAVVSVDALPGRTFPAKVTDVSQEGTYSQGVSKFSVQLAVEPSPQLRAQMTATATILVAEKEQALLVPAEAVAFLGDGSGTVNVVGADGKIAETKIEIGLYNDSKVEVLSGLQAGAVVITGTVSEGSGMFPGMGGGTSPSGTIPGMRPR